MMDSTTKTTATKPASSPRTNVAAEETLEKMSAASAEAAALIKGTFSTAISGAQDYTTKIIEFAHTNSEAAFDFAHKVVSVKSPSDFVELSADHSRKQFETLAAQAKELAVIAQKVALATAEPVKTGVTKVFSQAA